MQALHACSNRHWKLKSKMELNEHRKPANQEIHEVLFPIRDQFSDGSFKMFSNQKHHVIRNAIGPDQNLLISKIKNLYDVKQCVPSQI